MVAVRPIEKPRRQTKVVRTAELRLASHSRIINLILVEFILTLDLQAQSDLVTLTLNCLLKVSLQRRCFTKKSGFTLKTSVANILRRIDGLLSMVY